MITKDTKIIDIISGNVSSVFILNKYNLQCAMCPERFNETLEEGAKFHFLDLDALLKDLNTLDYR